MSWQSPRMAELREEQARIWEIRLRIEKRYKRLRSFSPAMRKHFAERDIRAAMVAAGLPLPVRISDEEKVDRMASLVRRDRSWLTGMEPRLRAAVLERLGA